MTEPDAVQTWLVPSLEQWQRHPVSKSVGIVKHDSPDLIEPIQLQQGLL